MANLTPEQQQQLDDLSALRDAPEKEEDFNVDIEFEGKTFKGIPYSKARSWMKRNGIDLDEVDITPDPPPGTDPAKPQRSSGKYFGSKSAPEPKQQ